jgi:3',5'-cyclic AMP phosphodiesterase CpdA
MRLLQLSDPHVRAPGDPLAGRVETLPFLERAVAAANRMTPAPDAVLLTGDIVDQMAPEEYRLVRTALERIACPLFLLPGNHDSRAGCREFLAPYLGEARSADCLAYVIDRFPLQIVMLDSVIPGRGEGLLGAGQLAWLEGVLREGPARPTLLALHHPPFEVGIGFMDRLGLTDRQDLARVIGRHPQIVGVVAGHVHRTIVGRVAGAVVLTAPSTAHQIPLDLTPDGPEAFVFEPPGFLLHEWDGRALRSHHGYIQDFGKRHAFV